MGKTLLSPYHWAEWRASISLSSDSQEDHLLDRTGPVAFPLGPQGEAVGCGKEECFPSSGSVGSRVMQEFEQLSKLDFCALVTGDQLRGEVSSGVSPDGGPEGVPGWAVNGKTKAGVASYVESRAGRGHSSVVCFTIPSCPHSCCRRRASGLMTRW